MGTGRTLNKAPRTRPTKKAGDRRRRETVQRRRLVALGLEEDLVKQMNTSEVRELLKKPAKLRVKD